MGLFAAVIEQGSFTAAAESLGVSKGFVSKRVSELERQLGVVLLHRTTRRLLLTAEGERFLRYCRDVVETAEEGWKVLQNRGSSVTGLLRITAPITYGQLFLPSLIQDFCQRFPEARVDLVLDNRAIDILADGFDLALRITDYPPNNYDLTTLGSMEDVVCAAPALLSEFGTPATPQQIRNLPCLLYLNPGRIRKWSFKKHRRVELVEVDGPAAYSHHGAMLGPLLQGCGVAKLPEYYVRQYIEQGALVRLLPDFECGIIPVYLVHQPPQSQPPRVREFIRMACLALGDGQSLSGRD